MDIMIVKCGALDLFHGGDTMYVQLSERRHLIPTLRDFMARGLAISPWLTGVGDIGRFGTDLYLLFNREAESYVSQHWNDSIQFRVWGTLPMPPRLPRTAFYEISASTAVSLAYEEHGEPIIDESLAKHGIELTRKFCRDYDLSTLVELYSLATGYENIQAIMYYDPMPEQNFIMGRLHRPWVDYSLQDELETGIAAGNYQIVECDGQRCISLTDEGRTFTRELQSILLEAGYLDQRIRQLHISLFNRFHDLREVVKTIVPDWITQRRAFLNWCGVQPGMHVLELGCGDGLFTFEGGLAQRIGPSGRIVAVDPANGMLARAKKQGETLGFQGLEFIQGYAEKLPFPDEAFDAVLGVSSLQYTDIPKALSEMKRVTRPGGVVASFHPVSFYPELPPFFLDWFRPLFQMASQRSERPKDAAKPAGDIFQRFLDVPLTSVIDCMVDTPIYYSDPGLIEALIRGTGWFQEELADIPWEAREDMFRQIRVCGRTVVERYPAEERVFHGPQQMIRGYV